MVNKQDMEAQVGLTSETEELWLTNDDRCCGHCKYYDGNGYCSDGKPVRPTDWCKDFTWA